MITFACINLLIALVCWFALGFHMFVSRKRRLTNIFAFLVVAFGFVGMGSAYYLFYTSAPHHPTGVAGSR